jgi:hypothetical protein
MKTHNERFSELENKYIESREAGDKGKSDSCINLMYSLLKEIAYNYIASYCKKRGLAHLDIKEKAHDAAMFVILQYIKKKNFRVKRISSYIHFGVLKSLFANKEIEMNEVSYEQYFNEKKDK